MEKVSLNGLQELSCSLCGLFSSYRQLRFDKCETVQRILIVLDQKNSHLSLLRTGLQPFIFHRAVSLQSRQLLNSTILSDKHVFKTIPFETTENTNKHS